MGRFRRSLPARMLAANLSVSALTVLALSGLFLWTYSRDLDRQLAGRAEVLADFIAGESRFAMLVGDRPELERIARNTIASGQVVFVELVDSGGADPVLLSRKGFPAGAVLRPACGAGGFARRGQSLNGRAEAPAPPAAVGGVAPSVRSGAGEAEAPALPAGIRDGVAPSVRSAAGQTFLEVTRQVMRPAPDGRVGWEAGPAGPPRLGTVRLGFSMETERAARVRIAGMIAGMALACLVLAFAVQALELRTLLAPLQSLTAFTRRVAAGDLGAKAEVVRPDEVGRLTAAFNTMIERLGATTVSKRYVDSIIESMAESVIVVDRGGRMRTVNQAALRLLGREKDDLAGTPAEAICPGAPPLETSGAGLELAFRGPGGAEIPVLLSAAPMGPAETGFEGAVWVAQDMTERKRVAEQLLRAKEAAEAANAAKSRFLANMGHELRTPLNAVIGYSQLLQEVCEERAIGGLNTDLAKIERAGEMLLELINQVLDFSKAEAGKIELRAESFDVREVIADVLASVGPLAARNRNRISVHADGEALAHTDLLRFRQSLLNLVANACKFTESGEVSVDVLRERGAAGGWIAVSVKDTGIGMSPEQQRRLFQAFVQGDSSTTRKYGGTGLGLAISRTMCRMLGGDISVESELGKGSNFTMRIPERLPQPASEGGDHAATRAAAAGG
jgi:signal transduction histidine kinase